MRTRADVSIWLAAGLPLALGDQLLRERLWVMSLVPVAGWAVTGLVLLVIHCLRLPSLSERYSRRWNVLGLIVGCLLFVPVSSVGAEALYQTRFRWHRAEYERVLATVEMGHTIETRLEYQVDSGPPKRVAFMWPGGILDNWCGIVHDRTGLVLEVNAQPPWSAQWRSHPATGLFGGDMFACRRFEGSYDLCCFT